MNICTDEGRRKPRLLIIGYARHGKDTVAEILRDRHGFSFVSSSYAAAELVCRPWLAERGITYATLDECYDDRVNHRAAWYDAISAFNAEDPTRLARMIFETNDMYVGMRSAREYEATRGLVDLVVWVDAGGRGLPREDPSSNDLRFEPGLMYLISNDGTFDDLRDRVDELVRYVL